MIDTKLIDLLACPICKQYPFDYEIIEGTKESILKGILVCKSCQRNYPINQGVPVLLPNSINSDLTTGKRWSRWSKKMKNFIAWRRSTRESSERAEEHQMEVNDLLYDFVNFCHLLNTSKRVLDVGCGSGDILRYFGSQECFYVGIDPLPISDAVTCFRMVQGVGEDIPFRDETFDDVVILQTLDHCLSPKGIVKETARVLKSRGTVNIQQLVRENNTSKLVVKSKVKDSVEEFLRFFFRESKASRPHECKMHFFTKDILCKLVSECFERIEIKVGSNRSQFFLKAYKK